jgi:imidazolonepropionase-like amidohydrolase
MVPEFHPLDRLPPGARSRCDNLIVDGERAVWVSNNHPTPAAGRRPDFRGATVIPDFVDSHAHLAVVREFSRRVIVDSNGTGVGGYSPSR